jgi:hypothetical protein
VAYNSNNKTKQKEYILNVYATVKHYDVPDTYIVRCIFPKHNIFISYRTWLGIKNIGNSIEPTNQLALFN